MPKQTVNSKKKVVNKMDDNAKFLAEYLDYLEFCVNNKMLPVFDPTDFKIEAITNLLVTEESLDYCDYNPPFNGGTHL